MSKGLNKVMIMGNLGADPEVRSTTSGSAITNIRVATSESWKDRNTNEKQERTEWHRIVLFNRLAEIAAQYLHKGSKVFIEGSIRTNKWQDQDGVDRYTTEIIASNMQLMDSRKDESNSGSNFDAQEGKTDNNVKYVTVSTSKPSSNKKTWVEDSDDDIPF